nr:MAG TPA: hypothetical protein [Caudoviricetes sp.]
MEKSPLGLKIITKTLTCCLVFAILNCMFDCSN